MSLLFYNSCYIMVKMLAFSTTTEQQHISNANFLLLVFDLHLLFFQYYLLNCKSNIPI